MNCKVTDEQLISYMLNELSLSEKRFLSEHIELCSSCKKRLDELYRINDVWDNPDSMVVSESFTKQVMESISDIKLKPSNIHNHRLKSVSHFLIASAATFLFFYSGIFHEIPYLSGQLSSVFAETTKNIEVTTIKGFSWLDTINFQLSNLINMFKI